MSLTTADIQNALKQIIDPNTKKDFVSTKSVKNIKVDQNQANPALTNVVLEIVLSYPANSILLTLRDLILSGLKSQLSTLGEVTINLFSRITSHAVQRNVKLIPGVKNLIAVFSGKGGVGKSTVAVNLALALCAEGAKVGILDADIYGPSQPMMLGLHDAKPVSEDGQSLEPLTAHGIQAMSIGFLIDTDTPMVWRGPMVTRALDQLLSDTKWKDLDYLIVDMPPGTGDIQLTLAQRVPVTGAVIVTTPQDIALIDARKGLKMFEKVGIPILGIVENMSLYICPKCGHEEQIFGTGGGEQMCQDYQVEFLGALPLDKSIRENADAGHPTVVAEPEGRITEIYKTISRRVAVKVAEQAQNYSSKFPTIVIQNS